MLKYWVMDTKNGYDDWKRKTKGSEPKIYFNPIGCILTKKKKFQEGQDLKKFFHIFFLCLNSIKMHFPLELEYHQESFLLLRLQIGQSIFHKLHFLQEDNFKFILVHFHIRNRITTSPIVLLNSLPLHISNEKKRNYIIYFHGQ